MQPDVYAYGMCCLSTIHVLDGPYPAPDSYREIKQSFIIPSGEAGNAALLLSHFGLTVKLDGPYLGTRTREPVTAFYNKCTLDCSGMEYDPEYPGVEDLVLVDASTRTIFGRFAHYHGSGENRWSDPDQKAITAARAVCLDPGFGEASRQTAKVCLESGTPYVTIDLRPEEDIHRQAAVTVISNEYLQREYPGGDPQSLFSRYTDNTRGLVIFTFGSRNIMFGRKDGPVNNFTPYAVPSKGSLAAGDFFRGGCVYALYQGWPDDRLVSFSAAVGALVCTRFPAALNPPSLQDVLGLMGDR